MDTSSVRDVFARVRARLQRARPWSLRLGLALLVASLALPLTILFVALLGILAESNREEQRASLLYTARSLLAAVDAQVGRGLAVANILAASPSVLVEDLASFESEARRASLEGAWVVVSDIEGRQLLNTAARRGEPLPRRTEVGLATAMEAMRGRKPVVSNIIRGPLLDRWAVAIDVPVFRGDQPYRIVTVALDAEIFHTLLDAHSMPNGWLAGVIDREGRFVARVPDNDDKLGGLAGQGWRAVRAHDGIFHFRTLEGDDVAHANANSTLTGWSVGVAAKTEEIEAATWRTLAIAILLGVVVFTASLVLAVWLAHHIARSILDLRDRARALIEGRDVGQVESPILELADFWSALKEAIAHRAHSEMVRRQQEEQIHMLMREVNHRSKNVLAVVQSIARSTAKSSPEQFVERFSERVLSLAASHDLLVSNNWRWTDLQDLVRAQLAHLGDLIGTRIQLAGPHVHLSSSAAQIIGMALHELATNASKYGALANETGSVAISWSWEGDAIAPQQFKMSWIERGGPPVAAPETKGFGSTVIDRLVRTTLSASVDLAFTPAGFEWHLQCPAEALRSGG